MSNDPVPAMIGPDIHVLVQGIDSYGTLWEYNFGTGTWSSVNNGRMM
jgi:hypothetical protein